MIEFPAAYIAALRHMTQDNRLMPYYGVIRVEIGRSESRLIAVDHTHAGMFYVPMGDEPVCASVPLSLFPKRKTGTIALEIGDMARVTYNGITESAPIVQAEYPDIRQHWPREVSGKTSYLNASIMARFQAVADIFHRDNKPHVWVGYNGNGACLVSVDHDDFAGMVMPMRVDRPLANAPFWVHGELS